MQPSTNVNIAPVQTGQVVLAQRRQSNLNVPVIQALAIIQIVFGAVSLILGIIPIAAISKLWINFISFGIWFGAWIILTGIIGIFLARKPQSRALNGTNMGFNICCSVVSLINGSFFAVAIAYYNRCTVPTYIHQYHSGHRIYIYGYWIGDNECVHQTAGIAIYSLLMLLMIAEFFVSLFISILCCKGSCCCKGTFDQRIQQHISYSANGPAVIATNTGYPQAAYPGTAITYSNGAPVVVQAYPQQGQMQIYPQQGQIQMYPQQGQIMVSQNPQQQGQMMFLQNPQQQGQMLFSQNSQQSQMMVLQNPQQRQMMEPQNPQQRQIIVSQAGMIAGQTNTVHLSAQQPEQPPEYQKSQLDQTDINTPQ